MKKWNIVITIIAFLVVVALLGVVGFGYYKKATMEVKNPVATIEVENFGTIKVELYPEYAPNTVANFIALANNGYYNGKTFYRVVSDFMIQAGTSNEENTQLTLSAIDSSIEKGSDKDTAYSIEGEFISNGYNKNTLKHKEGVISMARADYTQYSSSLAEESYNSAGADFFIMTKDTSSLDGYYAAFGAVIEGMDVVHAIEAVEVEKADEDSGNSEESTPVNPPVITSVSVDTFGYNYELPKTVEPFDYQSWLYSQYGVSQ